MYLIEKKEPAAEQDRRPDIRYSGRHDEAQNVDKVQEGNSLPLGNCESLTLCGTLPFHHMAQRPDSALLLQPDPT
ncbi:hypothetical protein [uncultured Cohaesibacter sp.]|uniref:hypothetical protein n=1 Tax=uncultured Cohaesibacter sp. TaxID=1002546 RepID=UPI00292EFC51|nr:hypothetical protein [uncultured Cohaesibacter sp.]